MLTTVRTIVTREYSDVAACVDDKSFFLRWSADMRFKVVITKSVITK